MAAGRRIPIGTCVAIVAIVLSLVVGAGPAYAATHIPTTTYTSNTTWTVANSPYVLDGNVTVASGVTLTINPGVIVKFNGTLRELRVNGTLSAVGTSGSRIVFTSCQDDSAGGDTNGDGTATAGAAGQWTDINVTSGNGNSQLKFADVRYGGNGSANSAYGALRIGTAGTSVTVEDSTFANNQRSGIFVSVNDTDGVTVRRTTLSNNGNGISVNQGWVKVEDNSLVRDNSQDGLWFNITSSFTGPQSSITDSEVRGNGRDGVRLTVDASLDASKWPRGNRNNIYNNAVSDSLGKQLFTLNTKRTADWKHNYWGDGLYFALNSGDCLGTGQMSRGKIGSRTSQANPPNGPISSGIYTVNVPETICGYDKVAIADPEFERYPWRSAGQPTYLSLGPSDGGGELGLNNTGSMNDPMNSSTGSSFNSATDLKMAGTGVTFAFTRTYNGIDSTGGPLGPGWTHSYNASLSTNAGGDVTVRGGSGQQLLFLKNADGSFTPTAGGRATLATIQGGYELITYEQLHYHFDTAGKLTSLKDRNSQGLTLSYDGNGRLSTITDAANRQVTLTYDGNGLLTQVALPSGRNVSYGYTSGRLTSVTDARGKVWTYTYEQFGLLEKLIDPLNHTVFRDVYGSDGRVIEQYDGLNHKTSFAWDWQTQTATATDARGNAWKDVYSNGLLTQRIDPLGNTTSYGYDSDLNLTNVTDARGKQTTMTYDSNGNLLSRTAPAPLSYQQTYTHNTSNDVLTAQDGRGNTTSYGYDSNSNLTSVTQPGNIVTGYGRNTSGQVTSITDPRGKVTNLEYDSAGNLTAVTTPLGNKTTMTYEASGRMLSSVDPRGNVTGANPDTYRTTYTYNASDQLLTTTDPLGNVTTNAYDDAGRLTSVTDPKTHVTSYSYDAADRLTSVTAPGSVTTSYGYDNVGNITSRTDPNNHQMTYAYDSANRLTSATNPLNKTWSLSYDANDNPTQVTKPSNGTVTVTYDALNRPIGLSFTDSTPSVSYSYDANSNRTQMVDGAGTQTYTYDALNRLTAVARGSDSFGYSYDDAGNITLRTYPDATSISYAYDDDERMSSVTRSGNSANYTYSPAGVPTQVTLPNSYVASRTYDVAGRVTQIKHSQGTNVLAQFDYTYDVNSNLTSITNLSGVETFGYDTRDRLTSACYQASCPNGSDPFIRWTYDSVGNRLTEARPTGTSSYTYDAADELTQAGSTTYTFDSDGNETAAGSRTFGWNLAGQMTSSASSGSTTNYSYDGDGNRLQATGTGTTNYLWDTNDSLPRLAVERNGSGSSLRSYTYGHDLLSMLAGGQNYYFHEDAVGSVRNITSASGQTEWTYSYEPFGPARAETKEDAMALDDTIRFAGEMFDADSGLYDLRARMYAPSTGRFLSIDPRPAPQDEPAYATYTYAADNPATYVDPSGLGRVWLDWKLVKDAACTAAIAALLLAPVPPPLKLLWLMGYLLACHGKQIIRAVADDPRAAAWNVVRAGFGCLVGRAFAARPAQTLAYATTSRLSLITRFVRPLELTTPQGRAVGCVVGAAGGLAGIRNVMSPQ
jgi:RHS repeat-associated protein